MDSTRVASELEPACEAVLRRFESAWQSGSPPPLEEFLQSAAGVTEKRRLLIELIKSDLDNRWRRSAPGVVRTQPAPERYRLDDYVPRFPELGPIDDLPADLIAEEYWVRRCWGDRPGQEEYLVRFPRQVDRLQDLLREIDAESAGGQTASRTGSAGLNPAARPAIGMPVASAVIPVDSVLSFLEALRATQVLRPAQLTELIREDLQRRFADPESMGKHLLERGLLTRYQVEQILQGRAGDLVLDHYVLLEPLGEGGAGQVFKARHQNMERLAAVKLIRIDLLRDPDMVRRFYREIEAVSQLQHPNIVHAYDAGPAGPTHFLAMEFVDGVDLSRLVKQQGPLPVEGAREYIRQAAAGLQYIHEHGMVHRDIKPSNLMVVGRRAGSVSDGSSTVANASGSAVTVKILDLGLARLQQRATGELATTITGSNTTMMGTVDYMAPEQAIDSHHVDIRADIYSLGCTLFYLLTRQPPFPGGTEAEKLVRHQMKLPPDVREMRPEVPEELVAILNKMLAKEPAQRFQSPAELLQALRGEISVTSLSALSDALPIAIPVALMPSSQTAIHGMPTATQVLTGAAGEQTTHIGRRKSRRTLLAIGGACLLVGAISVLVLSGRQSPEGTAKITKPVGVTQKEPPLFEDKFTGGKLNPRWKLPAHFPWKVVLSPDGDGWLEAAAPQRPGPDSSFHRALWCGELDWRSYAVEASLGWAADDPDSPTFVSGSLLARANESEHSFYFMSYGGPWDENGEKSPQAVSIGRVLKGRDEKLTKTFAVPRPEPGKWYRLRFEVANSPSEPRVSRLRAFLNGKTVAEVADDSLGSGRAGISRGSVSTSDRRVMWKDIRVEKLPQ
jgi:serine/threonine-protein kinase